MARINSDRIRVRKHFWNQCSAAVPPQLIIKLVATITKQLLALSQLILHRNSRSNDILSHIGTHYYGFSKPSLSVEKLGGGKYECQPVRTLSNISSSAPWFASPPPVSCGRTMLWMLFQASRSSSSTPPWSWRKTPPAAFGRRCRSGRCRPDASPQAH